GERRSALASQDRVFGDREAEHQSRAAAVLRYESDAGLSLGQRVKRRDVLLPEDPPAACRAPSPRQPLHQLALAVPFDACDAEDLALAELERNALEGGHALVGVGGHVLDL